MHNDLVKLPHSYTRKSLRDVLDAIDARILNLEAYGVDEPGVKVTIRRLREIRFSIAESLL